MLMSSLQPGNLSYCLSCTPPLCTGRHEVVFGSVCASAGIQTAAGEAGHERRMIQKGVSGSVDCPPDPVRDQVRVERRKQHRMTS